MEKVGSFRDGNETRTGSIRFRSEKVFTLVFFVFFKQKNEEEESAISRLSRDGALILFIAFFNKKLYL